jgi:ribosomal protein S18 acetylase RimI-like enzyme
MQIRACTQQDIPAIEAFTFKFFPVLQHIVPAAEPSRLIGILAQWRKAHPNATQGIFVAEEGQQIIGTIFISLSEDSRLSWRQQWQIVRQLGFWAGLRAWLVLVRSATKLAPHESYTSGIAIEPAYRRHGIGRALIAAAEEYARDQDKQLIYCYIAPTNTASRNLMTQMGYKLNLARPWLAQLLRIKSRYLRYEKNLG